MTTTLIATLGQSPGAVTGLYLELAEYQQPKQPIDRVHLLGTKDNDVVSAARIVQERLKSFQSEIIPEFIDDDDFAKVDAFQKLVTLRLHQCSTQGNVIVGITGGRTGMGAMLAIASQFYKDVQIYHYWVSNDITADGSVEALGKLKRLNPERYKTVLDPHRQEDSSGLVQLPAINLEEKRYHVEKYRTSDLANEPSDGIMKLKEVNTILRLLPRRMTIDQAVRYTSILIEIQNGAEPSTQLEALVNVLSDAGITGIRNHLRALLRIPDAEPEKLQQWVNEVVRSREYWTEGLDETYQQFQSDEARRLLKIGTSAAVVSAIGTFMQGLLLIAQHLKL